MFDKNQQQFKYSKIIRCDVHKNKGNESKRLEVYEAGNRKNPVRRRHVARDDAMDDPNELHTKVKNANQPHQIYRVWVGTRSTSNVYTTNHAMRTALEPLKCEHEVFPYSTVNG